VWQRKLWVEPQPIIWDVVTDVRGCLSVAKGDMVVVPSGCSKQLFRSSAFDEWSWCYRVDDPTEEGWIPTLSHTVLVATETMESPGDGVARLEQGDLLVARGQKGLYLWGWKISPGSGSSPAWYPKGDDALQPLHPAQAVQYLLN